MTLLSILLWIIDIAGTIKIVGSSVSVILICAALGTLGVGWIINNEGNTSTIMPTVFRWFKKLIIYGVIVGMVSLVIPSRTTLYMIVGVEAANAVITNEYSKEIMLEIKNVVIDRIKETSVTDAAKLANTAKELSK